MASTRRWSVTLFGRICPSTMLRRAAAYSDMAVAYNLVDGARRQAVVRGLAASSRIYLQSLTNTTPHRMIEIRHEGA
ncbi:hypothetical protein D3C72_2436030 [compost metagenome]